MVVVCSQEKLISDARRLRGGGRGEDDTGVVVALPGATGEEEGLVVQYDQLVRFVVGIQLRLEEAVRD